MNEYIDPAMPIPRHPATRAATRRQVVLVNCGIFEVDRAMATCVYQLIWPTERLELSMTWSLIRAITGGVHSTSISCDRLIYVSVTTLLELIIPVNYNQSIKLSYDRVAPGVNM